MSDLFFGIYRFSGIPYHRWFCTANKKSAMYSAQAHASRRNVDVPSERTELVVLYEVGVEISKARADQFMQQMYDERKKKRWLQPEDLPDRELIWHQPVTQQSRLSVGGGWPSDFRISNFRI